MSYRFRKHPIFSSLLVLCFIEAILFTIFSCISADVDIISASMTGVAMIGGYFITHYLELIRKQEERRYDRYSEFLKGLRFLILEKDVMGTEQQKVLLDEFQFACFKSALIIDDRAYKNFKSLMGAFENLIAEKDEKNQENLRKTFQEKQSEFINDLRKEYRPNSSIEFQTWDIRLPKKPLDTQTS